MSFRISIASGKGGTGKTLLSVSLAYHLKENEHRKVALVDLDVEEPNSSIFMKGYVTEVIPATRPVPKFDKMLCTNCNACADICMFNALLKAKEHVLIYKNLCHSCNACVRFCPTGALQMADVRIGEVRFMNNPFAIPFVEGVLDIKEEMSAPLIALTKDYSEKKFSDSEFIFYDSPPGTSCSYIEAIKDSDLVLIITEPTPFGMSDSAIAIETALKLNKETAVVINRSVKNSGNVKAFFEEKGCQVIAEIMNDRSVAEAYSRGDLPPESNSGFKSSIKTISDFIFSRSIK